MFGLVFFIETILVSATENQKTLAQVEYCAESAI